MTLGRMKNGVEQNVVRKLMDDLDRQRVSFAIINVRERERVVRAWSGCQTSDEEKAKSKFQAVIEQILFSKD